MTGYSFRNPFGWGSIVSLFAGAVSHTSLHLDSLPVNHEPPGSPNRLSQKARLKRARWVRS